MWYANVVQPASSHCRLVRSTARLLQCKFSHPLLGQTYHRFGARNASKEDEVGHEEADAEVEVDGLARPLYGAAERECQNAQHQTQQGHAQSHLCYQQKPKRVLEERQNDFNRCK